MLRNKYKRFYDRETIAASNYEIRYATQIINPFLNSRISDNHDKVGELSANSEILIKEIVYLF